MDGLDKDLRSNRETLSAGPLLEDAQNLLRSVFNAVRPTLERHDADESPGAKLARKLASSPSSLSRRPIFDLAIAVVQGNAESNFLNIPKFRSTSEKDDFLQRLEERLENNEELLKKLSIDYKDSSSDFIARFDLLEGQLRINAWHPFVATFHDEFTNKNSSQPLEILAMSEILAESQLHMLGVKHSTILDYLHTRDQLIRYLANESGRQSALAVSNNLINNRNNASGLEGSVCDAFSSLGFEVTPLAKKGEPDGVANANTSAQSSNNPTSYKISLEAKSKVKDGKKVSAKSVGISTIARQRDDWECDHSVVVGPAFPTTQGDQSALLKEIDTDRKRTAEENNGHPKTITLITIDDLAKLVRLRPIKQLGLQKLRTLFSECRSPEESHDWVNKIAAMQVTKPPYRRIIQTIEATQRKFKRAPVTYAALRTELSHLDEPIIYETDNDLHELCKGMAQMAPGAIHALDNQVELDQSTENVLSAIDAATQEYPLEEQ